jgi:hypothetical protein
MSALWFDATCRAEESGVKPPQSKSEIIGDVKPVGFETLHGLHKGGRGILGEPRSGTPWVIFRERHDAMLCRIGMNIMQAREIRAFKCDMTVPELKPDFTSGRGVLPVQFLRGFHVQLAEKFPQRAGFGRRCGDEMIMVCQRRPRAQRPVEFAGASEKRFEKEIQPLRRVQMRKSLMCARRNHVNARLKEPVPWRVWPVHEYGVFAENFPPHKFFIWSARTCPRFGSTRHVTSKKAASSRRSPKCLASSRLCAFALKSKEIKR